jgi:protein involved in polysaccharide export with SLBB domain
MKIITTVVIFFMLLTSSITVSAQDILMSKDLSSYSVEKLSESDISKIRTQLQFNNLTIEQVEPMVLAKGMTKAAYDRLKQRLNNEAVTLPVLPTKRDQELPENNIKSKKGIDKRLFGADLFDNPTLDFAPNLQLATPLNYILGPGDELAVSVYGTQEMNSNTTVSPEGGISIQHVGDIQVAGMTIEAAIQKIKTAIGRIYSSVRSGGSQVGISLIKIRSIKVTIIGSKLPGNYTLSSLSTVFNALYLSGGPSANGSYRNIELLRNDKILAVIDIYRFLVNGSQADNIGLRDNDVIRIPAYSKRVTLDGQVKVPGIFELKEGETFNDLISFASGFTDIAYTSSVSIVQKTEKEYKIVDLSRNNFGTYHPQSGDVVTVGAILDRFENSVKIEGAVFRPNVYSFTPGMRILDLLQKGDGLKEDAYSKRAILLRTRADLTKEIINIDLGQAMSGNINANIQLQKDDQLTIYSILDFEDEKYITINGEVRNPGKFTFTDSITLNDLLIQSGGLIGSASKKVEIARMVKSDSMYAGNGRKIVLFNLEINTTSNEQVNNFVLQPFDIVNIRKMAVYEIPETVSITGAVMNAGVYALENRIERIRNIITRAGGLTPTANIHGVKIKRPIKPAQIDELEKINISADTTDTETSGNSTTRKLKNETKYLVIPVEWTEIEKDPNSSSNIPLSPGDEIEIATQSESVKVGGNVVLNSEIPFVKGKGFKYYINAVGGTTNKAWKKKAFIVYPNGKAAVTKKFLFFRIPPKVTSGSQILIPDKPSNKKLSASEIVSLSSVLVGLAGVVIAILR